MKVESSPTKVLQDIYVIVTSSRNNIALRYNGTIMSENRVV